MPYNTFTAVDEDYKFPPEIRQAMAVYSELLNAFATKALEATVVSHNGNGANPHGTTKTQVGLGNADNTSDVNKPVSTAQQTALDLKAPLASPAFTGSPTGITKTHVGLANVDNTTDANKPISTAQATANSLLAKGQIAAVANAAAYTGIVGSGVVADYVQVDLVIGRRYRAVYKFTSITNATSLALATNLIKSVTADVSASGTPVEDALTVWTAPTTNAGSTHIAMWTWVASATETVNLKGSLLRATGSVGIDVNNRRLVVIDEGKQF